jgi:ribosomal protein S18 acetylase RimI-like enzyme
MGAFSVTSVSLLSMREKDEDGYYKRLETAPLLDVCFFSNLELDKRAELVSVLHKLEAASYKEDEAASLETMTFRARDAGDLFMYVFRGEELVGFVNGTSAKGALTHETMWAHVPDGEVVCVHSVVVQPDLRRQGIGHAILKAFVEEIRSRKKYQRIALLSKEHNLKFYSRIGFEVLGESAVFHGADKWFDCQLKI